MTFKGLTTNQILRLFEETDSILIKKDMLAYVESQIEFLHKRLAKINSSRYTMRRFKILKDLQDFETLYTYFKQNVN